MINYNHVQKVLTHSNTTNGLEGVFSNLKTKLRVHAGLKRNRKIKVIDQYLAK
ncbi:MAG: hypothetical protein IIB44_12955 [Candidatus Marinimicrobia bacterium]|nr:hypothetical protein [Candidatus Neomarinimicrobiota bacterium]